MIMTTYICEYCQNPIPEVDLYYYKVHTAETGYIGKWLYYHRECFNESRKNGKKHLVDKLNIVIKSDIIGGLNNDE